MTVLAVYQWHEFWSMGEGRGAPSFFLSVTSFPRRGHDMHVVMPGFSALPRTERYHGVTLHRFPTRFRFNPEPGRSRVLVHAGFFFLYLYWFVRSIPAAMSLARRVRPDVVIGMGPLGAPAARFVAGRLRVPNITRLFGTELDQVAGSRVRRWLRYWQLAGLTTPADYIIMHNDGSGGDRAARRAGVDMERFMFWPDGIDKRLFGPHRRSPESLAALGVPVGHKVILSVSRLHSEKHVERLLKATPPVFAALKDVTLLIVGDGEERGALEAAALSLGIADRTIFAGSVPRETLPPIYASADVFVTLSDRTNAFNPLYEAMISGLSIVALNTGRTSDFIEDGVTGILVEPDSLSVLPKVLTELLSDDDRRRTMGDAAHREANRRFPTVEERQDMEAEIAERAVKERAPASEDHVDAKKDG
ncbi:MAG: glycosyltransferase family 4 protein [Armatimonadetes bacterium]|nr:glycosyltransferase family 4 protein [Armatimonadota bacterium]